MQTVLDELERLLAERNAAFDNWDADPNWGKIHKATMDALPSLLAAARALEKSARLIDRQCNLYNPCLTEYSAVAEQAQAALAPLFKEVGR